MRYFATYLIYIAVVTRAAGWSQDNTQIPLLALILLAIFGVLLFSQRAVTHSLSWYPRLYILTQSGLVIAMLYFAPQVDIFPMLFFTLSFQAVQYFSIRIGFGCIVAFSMAMAGMLLVGMEFEQWIVMLLLSTGANVVMGSFALLIKRTERSRRENQRQFGELQDAYRDLENYAAQAEALAAAEERQRIVRELHDSLTQTLFSMNLAVQAAQLAARQDPDHVMGYLHRLKTLSRSAVSELQALTGHSPASALPGESLGTALGRLVAERQAQNDLQIALVVTGEHELSGTEKTNLYHIAQEALNNVAKHAGVCRVSIRLDLAGKPASLEIADTGCGFDLAGIHGHGGIGLDSMAERAREIGWEWKVTSAPGKGTQICVWEKKG